MLSFLLITNIDTVLNISEYTTTYFCNSRGLKIIFRDVNKPIKNKEYAKHILLTIYFLLQQLS